MSNIFDRVMVLSQSLDGIDGIIGSPNLFNPIFIEQLDITVGTGNANDIQNINVPFTTIDNGWFTVPALTSGTAGYMFYVKQSNRALDANLTLGSTDTHIYSIFDSAKNIMVDRAFIATPAAADPIVSRTNFYSVGITAISNVKNPRTFSFTTTVDAKDRKLINTRVRIQNRDQTLVNMPINGILFYVKEYGSATNIIICEAIDTSIVLSDITNANVAKLTMKIQGLEDLPVESFIYKLPTATGTTTVFKIYNRS